MCATCGCGEGEVRVSSAGATHPAPATTTRTRTRTRTRITGRRTAPIGSSSRSRCWPRTTPSPQDNRAWLADRRITALNLMSSPGSGKTTLLERTILAAARPVSVIEGDQETPFDADRIRAAGARAVQINTGTGCHLDAAMVARPSTG